MRRYLAAALFATVVTTGAGLAAQQSGAAQEVLQAQAARNKAILAQDLKGLEAILADDLLWVHSSGNLESKAQFLERVRTGASRWLKLEPHDMKVRVTGDTAVVKGEVHQTTTGPGRPPADRTLHTLEVFVRSNGRWLLADFQAVALPEQRPGAAPR